MSPREMAKRKIISYSASDLEMWSEIIWSSPILENSSQLVEVSHTPIWKVDLAPLLLQVTAIVLLCKKK